MAKVELDSRPGSYETDKAVDHREIVESVKRKYADLALGKADDPGFLHGRELAELLEYAEFLSAIPEGAIESFAGVGNPVRLSFPQPGERVLDIGSGAGLDSLVTARLVGPTGSVVGVDMTEEMVDKARRGATKAGLANVEFLVAPAEKLPFEDEGFDLIITNGVINLAPEKEPLLKEAYRVLRPGGRLAASDVVLSQELLPEIMADPYAWAC